LELVEYDDWHDCGLRERLERQFEQGVKCWYGIGVARTLERDRDADSAERDAEPASVQEPLGERAQLAVQLLRVGTLDAVGDLGYADYAIEVNQHCRDPLLVGFGQHLAQQAGLPVATRR